MNRDPDFNNILKVLNREAPSRPTLFDFFMNYKLYERLSCEKRPESGLSIDSKRFLVKAFTAAGYDYTTVHGSFFSFKVGEKERRQSISLNDAALITDRKSFSEYVWNEPDDHDYSAMKDIENDLPRGMKLMVAGPGGVLENVIRIMGYDKLCMLLYDDVQLVYDVFEGVGHRLLRYYENSICFDSVGFVMSNDDWGFNTQTMLTPAQMREFVFPWHKKIVELAHSKGLPIVLHSCGFFGEVMDDVIKLGYQGKHSFEDNILSVEESYKKWHKDIAILGGIDMNFLITKPASLVTERSRNMLSLGKTGYALGSGNSIPEYVPQEQYFAMIKAIEE